MILDYRLIWFTLALIFPFFLGSCHSADDPVPVREDYLPAAEGGSLYYRILGNAPDTLVVLHGGPGAGIPSVLPAVKPLADTFTLLLYDQRGGGRSVLPEDTTRLQARYYVEDLEAVRQHFGLARMNLLTHSFGSILAARYAQRYPDRINRMVLHASTGPLRSQAGAYYRAKSLQATASPDSALSSRSSELFRSLLRGTAVDPVAACREYEEIGRKLAESRGEEVNYAGTTCDAPPEAVAYYYRYTAQLAPHYFGAWDFTGSLSGLLAPVLVVYGQQDSLGIPMQQAWVDALPDARLLLVEGAGKPALSDRPDLTVAALNAFFKGSWPDDAR